MKEEYNIASLSSLVIHCEENEILSVISDEPIKNDIISSVKLYNFFKKKILSNYILLFNKSRKTGEYITDDNDYKYSKLIYSEITIKSLHSQVLINVFLYYYFLIYSLFFLIMLRIRITRMN